MLSEKNNHHQKNVEWQREREKERHAAEEGEVFEIRGIKEMSST